MLHWKSIPSHKDSTEQVAVACTVSKCLVDSAAAYSLAIALLFPFIFWLNCLRKNNKNILYSAGRIVHKLSVSFSTSTNVLQVIINTGKPFLFVLKKHEGNKKQITLSHRTCIQMLL